MLTNEARYVGWEGLTPSLTTHTSGVCLKKLPVDRKLAHVCSSLCVHIVHGFDH